MKISRKICLGILVLICIVGNSLECIAMLHAVPVFDSTRVVNDSTYVHAKNFDGKIVDELKSDPDMQYKEPPSAAESLWERILRWFLEIIEAIFSKATNTGWGVILTYIVGITLIVILIMMIFKVNAFKVLYSAKGAAVKGDAFHENIHEMDFDSLIREAVEQQDYRKGVRLLFLYALKILADKHLIRWEPGKTNHEYVGEVEHPELKAGLDDLSYYFDYAWYGNFKVTSEIFQQAQSVFSNWKQTVR
jgi:hypothetical protein